MGRAVLLDIDGVLMVSWEPLPGAIETVDVAQGPGTSSSGWSPTPRPGPGARSPDRLGRGRASVSTSTRSSPR